MKKPEQEIENITNQLYGLIVPKDILQDFEILNVSEQLTSITIFLVEKSIKKPVNDKELVQNGFMNPIDIQGFPIQGKPCYYQLKRRRWKEKGTKKDCFNTYSYIVEKSKTTQEFGAFLKELGL